MPSLQRMLLSAIAAISLASWTLAIDLTSSPWIWTPEHASTTVVPVGSRPFRKTVVPPTGKNALFADILIAADNRFIVYVNGVEVGRRTNNDSWWTAGRYCVGLRPGNNVFAVNATNDSLRAGVEFAAIIYWDDLTSTTIVSDTTWRTLSTTPPSGFEQVTYSDASWQSAIVVNSYAGYPYSAITVPAGPDACKAILGCLLPTSTVLPTVLPTRTVLPSLSATRIISPTLIADPVLP